MSTPHGSDRPGDGRPGDGAAEQPTYPAQPGYAAPGYAPEPVKPKNGMGTAALVFGILAVLTFWFPVLGAVLAIVAIILGVVGRGRVRKGVATNGGVALTGLILGVLVLIVNIIISVVFGFGLFAFFSSGGGASLQQAQDCLSAAQNQPDAAAVQQAVQQCSEQFGQQLPQFSGQ